MATKRIAKQENAPAQWELPEDLVNTMRESAFETLITWFDNAGLPKEVKELFRSYSTLEFDYTQMCNGQPPAKNEGLLNTYVDAADAIEALGGAFNGCSTYDSHVAEHAQAWAAARQ